MSVRLSVNLNDEVAEALKDIAEKRGLTATEAVRRAIAWYKFIDDEVVEGGRKIQLVDPKTDKVSEVAVVG
ncbi:ribbon-helix-helix protein, CopG family [Rhodococcus erythropolis]|uniref:ribbon-helix-helix protein, CopG family n=1 Tax=Rhodococcus erythropolis TaxID=1833 RepID=UPI0037B849B8